MQISIEGDVHFIVTDPLGRRSGVDPRGAPSIGEWIWFEEIPNSNYAAQGVGSLDPKEPGVGMMEFVRNLISAEDFGEYLIQMFGVRIGVSNLYMGASGDDTSITQDALFVINGVPIDKDSSISFRFTYHSSAGSPASLVKILNANSLLQDVAAMRKLDWITTETALDKYRGLITTYWTQLWQNDPAIASGTLNTILRELVADSAKTMTSDACKLLRADVTQLLGFDGHGLRK